MKRNQQRIAALRALRGLNISTIDAETIECIASRLQECNEAAWPDAARFWWTVTNDDGTKRFWLGHDEYGEDAQPRHVSELERRQIFALGLMLWRYPRLAAIHRPDPSCAAIVIGYAPHGGEIPDSEGILILPRKPPTDGGGILG